MTSDPVLCVFIERNILLVRIFAALIVFNRKKDLDRVADVLNQLRHRYFNQITPLLLELCVSQLLDLKSKS